MKWFLLISVLLTLCGCGTEPVWEVVEDLQPVGNVTPWQEAAYEIGIELPEDAALVGQTEEMSLYETTNTEIMTARFLAADYADAVRYLSGYGAEKLNILQTSRFAMPEYQFAWYSETAEGGRLYRADLVMDGMTCYAVVCSTLETGGNLTGQVRQVFASFDLLPADAV